MSKSDQVPHVFPRWRSTGRRSRGTWTLTDARARLSEVVQAALDGEPQRILRHGREVVVVVSAAAYDVARPRRSLAELFTPLRGTALDLKRSRDDMGEVPAR